MPAFTWKMNIFHLSPWKPQKCVLKSSEQGLFFKTIDLRGHMPRFILKMNVLLSISLDNPRNECWNPQKRVHFSQTINLRGHMPTFTWKMNMFSHLSSWQLHKCVWNPQNRAHFSKMIDLRGHMPMFTLKMNIFPSISLETPKMCVEILRTGLVFPRWLIWGVTCLGLLSKWMFCYLSPWKPHKWVLKPSEQGSFLQDNRFEGSHA